MWGGVTGKMAEKEVIIKVKTQTDTAEVEDLKTILEQISDNDVALNVQTDTSDVEELEDEIEDIENTSIDIDVDDSELDEGLDKVEELDSSINNIPQVDIETDSTSIDNATTSADELAGSLDEAGASADNLNNTLGGITGGGLDDAANSADNLNDSLSKSSESAQETSDSLSTIEGATLMGVGSQLQSYASGAESLAQEMNRASISVGQLATQTGMAEPQMVSLITTISNATFPAEEAMMYVKSLDQIGVSSQNLGKSATDLDKINDAFGLGASKVNSLGQELSVLGVDMNNVSSAFNALAYANANTVGGMDNYYTFLRKYDAEFKELGFNVDQASVIIAAATQKFGGGRAALSGLSDALKEANGDTRKLEEALGMEAGSIENASALTGQYEGQLQSLANEEAEHKTMLDQIGAAWEDISLQLGNVLSPLASAVGMIGQMAGLATSLNGMWELTRKLRELEIMGSVSGQFTKLRSILISVGSTARVTAASIATTMVSALRSAASAAVTLATELAAAGKAALLAGYNALKSAALWAAEKAAKIASSVASGIATAAQWALNIAMSANPIMLVVLAIAALIAILAYLYFNNEQVRNAINALGQALVYVGQLIYSVAITAVQNLVSAWQNTISFFTTLPGRIGQILSNVINRVVSWASQMISRFRTAATQAVNNFINGIAQLPGKVYNELAKTLNRVIQWGSQIVAKLSSIAQQAWQAFVSGLGIGSPGYIQILTLKELDDTAEGMARIKRTMMTNISNTAKGVVDAWGNPVFNYGFSADTALDELANGGFGGEINMGDTGLIRAIYSLVTALEQFTSDNTNNGDMTFILNGDMDNEDRMKRFLEYVRRELFWNNKTANRTV